MDPGAGDLVPWDLKPVGFFSYLFFVPSYRLLNPIILCWAIFQLVVCGVLSQATSIPPGLALDDSRLRN